MSFLLELIPWLNHNTACENLFMLANTYRHVAKTHGECSVSSRNYDDLTMQLCNTSLEGYNKVRWHLGQEAMFEPEVFLKQIYCIEESTCDIFGTSCLGTPIVIWCPGNCVLFILPCHAHASLPLQGNAA